MADTAASSRSVLREIALTAAAAAGVLCVLAAVAGFAFGVRPLVFRSGSMAPTVETGGLALARTVPASELQRGDVVSVINAAGVRITHRITSLTWDGERATLVLKGDANRVADAQPYTVAEADRVIVAVNGLGYVVAWLSSTPAVFLGGALVGGLLVYAFVPGASRRPRRAMGVGILVVGCLGGLAVPQVRDTEAAWTDAGQARSGALSAMTVAVPTGFTCNTIQLPRGAEFSWSGSAADRYEITYTPTLIGSPVSVDVPAGETSIRLTNTTLATGTATLRRFVESGSTRWYSQPSAGRGYLVLLGIAACA